MKTVKNIFICLAVCIALNGCAQSTESDISESDGFEVDGEYYSNYTEYWYDSILIGLNQLTIEESTEESNSVAEYRVIKDFSFVGIFYYALNVYEDGTGKFTVIVHKGEFFSDTEDLILLNESADITANDVNMLLKVIEKARFWNIPTEHPDENLGCDGATVFIEGYIDGKSHFIHMWEPDEKYGIEKIYETFRDYSEKIAENPLADYEY